MKKFLIFLLVIIIALSCSSRRFDIDPHRVEPSFKLAAIWVDGLYDITDSKVHYQIWDLQEDSSCHSKYSEKNDCYSFSVLREPDTITIDISKLLISSNLSFVKILVSDAYDSSQFEIGRCYDFYSEGTRQSIWIRETNYLSNLQATRPIKVSVFLYDATGCNVNKNVNKTMSEYRKELYYDSLRRNLDSVINLLKTN